MAPRPRKRKYTTTPNLYVKRDSRNGKLYCQYRDQRTGKFHGLPSNLEEAEQMARELNVLIGQEILDLEKRAILERDNSRNITVGTWIEKYIQIQAQRMSAGEIKQNTYDQKRWMLKPVLTKYKDRALADLNTIAINDLLQEYVKQGKPATAQHIRAALVDVFAEAIAAGHFPADKPNPASVTKKPRAKVRRSRLSMDVFLKVLEYSKTHQASTPCLYRSFLLAVLTGQRLGDVGNAKFKNVRSVEGTKYLEIVQIKTGTKILIPLALKLDAIDLSVGDVISMCRDRVVSPYLFHHIRNSAKASPGDRVQPVVLSKGFAKAIRALDMDWGDNTPPSFHEIRSLAEREYKKQGINTKDLLGHKNQSTTDMYSDSRGMDFIVVKV